MKDGEEVLNEDTGSSVLHTVLNAINNAFEPKCLNNPVTLLDSRPIWQSNDYWVFGNTYSISTLPGTLFLAHQVWSIWLYIKGLVQE